MNTIKKTLLVSLMILGPVYAKLESVDLEKTKLCKSLSCFSLIEQKTDSPFSGNVKIIMVASNADGVQYTVTQLADSKQKTRYFSIVYSLPKNLVKDPKQFLDVSQSLEFIDGLIKLYTDPSGGKILANFKNKKDIATGSTYNKSDVIYKMKIVADPMDARKIKGMLLIYGNQDKNHFGRFPK